ncbi:hypothetical protein CEY16_05350 [Halalkalibacillus sediminis]|uniref:DUF4352 domain-containing protein n=1 Tax=Halalkalibacillus sediminis TaxID=2018042 RepID=A0A2I0QXV8_9BACI|nr:hypothetical protein [Halalkalibacillus sediminis]PKR79174.1 hypothetical protein CEY16_05350 [Halalkalibacillus sediminis]
MKKFILFMGLAMLLVGCSGDDQASDTNKESADEAEEERVNHEENGDNSNQEESETENESEEENEINQDRNEERYGALQEIGETAEDRTGKRELINVKKIDEVIEHGPIEIDIVNAKVLEWTDLDQQSLNYLQPVLGTDQKTVHYLQIMFNVKNTSDKDVYWYGMDTIVADEQQIDAYTEDIIGDVLGPEVYAGTEDNYVVGYILNDEVVDSLRVVFDSVTDLNSYETIEEKTEFKVEFD